MENSVEKLEGIRGWANFSVFNSMHSGAHTQVALGQLGQRVVWEFKQ